MALASSTLSMKLLVDTKVRRVLYAEAGKDVVDFLFSLLALPADGDDLFAGSVGNLYRSAKRLDGADAAMALLSQARAACLRAVGRLVRHAFAPSAPAVAVLAWGNVDRYTVTDDLRVAPMSFISCVALLGTLRVRDIGALEEKTVQLGPAVGLEILKASLMSKTVLTDVFLGEKKASRLRGALSMRGVAKFFCWILVLSVVRALLEAIRQGCKGPGCKFVSG